MPQPDRAEATPVGEVRKFSLPKRAGDRHDKSGIVVELAPSYAKIEVFGFVGVGRDLQEALCRLSRRRAA